MKKLLEFLNKKQIMYTGAGTATIKIPTNCHQLQVPYMVEKLTKLVLREELEITIGPSCVVINSK